MPKRLMPVALALSMMVAAGGCLVQTTLNADNSGTMKVAYHVGPKETVETLKQQFASDNVEITHAALDEKRLFTVELKYKDITKLGSSKFFANIPFTASEDKQAGTKTIVAKLTNKKPVKLPDEQLEAFGRETDFSITVPGEIVKTNGTEKKGQTAYWKKPLNDVLGATEMTFDVTFKPGAAAAAPKAETPKAGGAK